MIGIRIAASTFQSRIFTGAFLNVTKVFSFAHTGVRFATQMVTK